MKIFRIIICIFFTLSTVFIGLAKNLIIVWGYVQDNQTNEKLSLVNVSVIDQRKGDMSDNNGRFEIELPQGVYQIEFSRVGYKKQKFYLDLTTYSQDSCYLNVELVPWALRMPNVIVFSEKANKDKYPKIKLEKSRSILNSNYMKEVPFTLNDINRSIQMLPGVNENNNKSSKFFARGGLSNENLYYLNGVEIHNPFHLKEMPTASISYFNINVVEKVIFYNGGFPAKFGDKLSSVSDIHLKQGNPKNMKSLIEISPTFLNLLINGPLGKKASYMFSLNRSNLHFAMDILDRFNLSKKRFIAEGIPDYYDFIGTMNLNMSPGHNLSLFYLNAKDQYSEPMHTKIKGFKSKMPNYYLVRRDSTISNLSYYSSVYMFGIKHRYLISSKSYMKNIVSLSNETETQFSIKKSVSNGVLFDHKNEKLGTQKLCFNNNYSNSTKLFYFQIKNSILTQIQENQEIESGISIILGKYYNYYNNFVQKNINLDSKIDDILFKIDTTEQQINNHKNDITYYKLSGFLQHNLHISSSIFSNFGLRLDYFELNKRLYISPRVSISIPIKNKLKSSFSWGVYYQSPYFDELYYPYPTRKNTKDEKAMHYILGINWNIKNRLILNTTIYYKDYSNLISKQNISGRIISSKENDSKGFSKGFDTQFSYSFSFTDILISYSYLIAKEKRINIPYYYRYNDQRHTIIFANSWNMYKGTKLSFKYIYGSGFSYTPLKFNKHTLEFEKDIINSAKYPPYVTLDLRLSTEFKKKWGKLIFFAEVVNLFDHKNVLYFHDYSIDQYGNAFVEKRYSLPRLPNAGLKIYFN